MRRLVPSGQRVRDQSATPLPRSVAPLLAKEVENLNNEVIFATNINEKLNFI